MSSRLLVLNWPNPDFCGYLGIEPWEFCLSLYLYLSVSASQMNKIISGRIMTLSMSKPRGWAPTCAIRSYKSGEILQSSDVFGLAFVVLFFFF